jgi:glycosyltransferase involved in cell wall biosynthesis
MPPLISIVIPHFERFELLQATIRSLETQTINCWEAIIVDDGSCNSTYTKVQSLASEKIRISQRQEGPKGPSKCRNLGIQKAQGDYILFLDSDDLLAPSCLDQRIAVAKSRDHLEMWVFPVELFRNCPGDLNQPWNNMRKGVFPDPLRRFLVSDCPWCVSSALWKRGAIERIGGFNESIMYGDDADLHIRALLNGLKYEEYPDTQPDVYIRRSDVVRITNTCRPELLESRRIRLREGTKTLRRHNAPNELLEIWEGQYFVEGEFLVFTQQNPRSDLRALKSLWSSDFESLSLRKQLAFCYFEFCTFFRKRFYLLLRIARRIAMRLFPSHWFPSCMKSPS